MKEIWKPVKEYENLYEISNTGKIKSKRSGKLLKPCKQEQGYLQIFLWKDGKGKSNQLHRLVAEAFLDKTKFKKMPNEKTINLEKLQVNHKDEIKTNNNVENLEWCTPKYNMNYGTLLERTKKYKQKELLQYDLNGNFIKKWDTMTEAKIVYNSKNNEITNCCKNRRKSYKNYIWKYNE